MAKPTDEMRLFSSNHGFIILIRMVPLFYPLKIKSGSFIYQKKKIIWMNVGPMISSIKKSLNVTFNLQTLHLAFDKLFPTGSSLLFILYLSAYL